MNSNLIELQSDVYYKNEYVDLYLRQGAKKFVFEYSEGEYHMKFSGILRRISKVAGIELDEELYDIESVYGYSGPITNYLEPDFLARAVNAYKEHCVSKNIVCEFMRLHPLANWEKDSFHFDLYKLDRNVVVKELPFNDEEELLTSYPKKTRNIIRKTRKNLSLSTSEEYLDFFVNAYYETMKKNDASNFYFFDSKYFNELISNPNVILITVLNNKEPVCGGFFMAGGSYGHYHLSANTDSSYNLNANYALLDAAFGYFMGIGINKVLLGGGRTNNPQDSLFKFKCKFSTVTTPFYIAGYDFMPNKRMQLNELFNKNSKNDKGNPLFQSYRMGDHK